MKVSPRDLPRQVLSFYQVRLDSGGKIGVVHKAFRRNRTTIVVWDLGGRKDTWRRVGPNWVRS